MNFKHGFNRKFSRNPTYEVWKRIRQRCSPRWHESRYYYDRGIRVCERWNDFKNFLADMGEIPPKMTIGRIDSKGNYCPENCRWEDRYQQAKNRSSVILYEIDGEKLCQRDWARKMGVSYKLISNRLRAGWDPREAILTRPLTNGESRRYHRKRSYGKKIGVIPPSRTTPTPNTAS